MAENNLETRVSVIETKVDDFIQEMRDFKNEMHQQNEMRAAEIARVDAKVEAMRAKHDADMKALAEQREKDNAKYDATTLELRKEIRDIGKHIQNMSIAVVVGLVAIDIGVLGYAFTRDSEPKYQAPPAQTQTVQTSSETIPE